jgi:SAM-dependent methyltransferase
MNALRRHFKRPHRILFGVSYRVSALITRRGIDRFVQLQLAGQSGVVLNLGSGQRRFAHKEVALDIVPRPDVDVIGDAHALPFASHTFEACALIEVLEHLRDPYVAVGEIRRVLRDGGRLVLTTRFLFPIHDAPHDYFRYTEFGLRELLRDWAFVEVHPQHDWYSTFVALFVRLINEDHWSARLLAPVIVAVGVALMLFQPLLRLLPFRGFTSGYFVVAER